MLHWGLTAAALLLFIFAVRTLFLSSKGDENKDQQKLGCGFAIVAAALWIYVLDHYLDDASGAIKIGIGVLLVLPSVRAIARPRGAPIIAAAAGLVLAVVIAGPEVQKLWQEHGLDFRPAKQRVLAERIEEAEELRDEYAGRLSGLEQLRAKVKSEIGPVTGGWEEAQSNPELLDQLQLLQRIDEEVATTESALATIDAYLPEMRAVLEAMEREEAEEPPGGESELEQLLQELQDAPPIDELPLGEQYERKQELQDLFEREF